MANAAPRTLLQALKLRFAQPESLTAMTQTLASMRKSAVPLKSYESLLAIDSLSALVKSGCPTTSPDVRSSEKILQSTKRLRAFLALPESTTCSQCRLREKCKLKDKQHSGPGANFLDLAKFLHALQGLRSMEASGYREQDAVAVMCSFDKALARSQEVDLTTMRELKEVKTTSAIPALRGPSPRQKKVSKLKENLKWKPSQQELLKREEIWQNSESKSKLSMIVKSIRNAISASRGREVTHKTPHAKKAEKSQRRLGRR